MRALLLTATVALSALAGCSPGATIDSAYGRPDATEWTYFEGPAGRVVDAISQFYSVRDVSTESARDESGGIVLTLSSQADPATPGQILVQSTTVGRFQSRAQLYPSRRPLPRDLEIGVTSDL